jgi:hypothetical protein
VSAKSCLACGRSPSDPHHLRFAQQREFGRKVSDEFTVPLYRVYFGRDGDVLIVLLTGGTKKRQQRDIKSAIAFWTDYKATKRGRR